MKSTFKVDRFHTALQTPGVSALMIRTAVVATFVSSLAFATVAQAAPDNGAYDQPQAMTAQAAPEQPTTTSQQTTTTPQQTGHGSDAHARQVEDRIKSLHDKLGITAEQEDQWKAVAQTMRDNESTISALIETRHRNVQGMTAIDDLQSYGEITQAHADGIKKLIPVFQELYGTMSDAQKKQADEAFGSFEGHGGKHLRKHS